MAYIPQDPIMLLSYVNTQLRDNYDSLHEMCASLDVDEADICEKLRAVGFEYVPELNQFK